jgi:arginine deiminase
MSRVTHLDAATIEGGDVMLHAGCVFVGLGEETSGVGVDSLRYRLSRLGGIDPVRVDYSEVTRIPGSFRYSTMPLCGRRSASMMPGNLAATRCRIMVV